MKSQSSKAEVPQAATTKDKILEAAISAFSDLGYSGTTTRVVCERAGVNGAALNYHWGTKDKLWLAACEWAGQSLLSVVTSRFDLNNPPADTIRWVVGDSFDALLKDSRPIRIMNWASLQADTLDFGLASERFQPIVRFGMATVEQYVRRGAVADMDYAASLATFWGMMLVVFIDQPGNRVFFGKDIGDAEHAKRMRASLIASALAILGLPDQPQS